MILQMLLSLCTFAMFMSLVGLVSFLDCLNRMQLKEQFNVTWEKIEWKNLAFYIIKNGITENWCC